MSYIIQHRKNAKRYSLKARKTWWVVITQKGLDDERYEVGNKAQAQAELEYREKEMTAQKYGIVLKDKLITAILDDFLSSRNYSKGMENKIKYIKEPFVGHKYAELTQAFYEQKRMEWKRHRKNRNDPLSKQYIRTNEKLFRAAICQYDSGCLFNTSRIKYVSVPKEGRQAFSIPDEEFKNIIDYLADQRRIVDFLWDLRYTGMRNGALEKLPWNQVDFLSLKITIPEVIGKGGTGTYAIYIDGRIFHQLIESKVNRKDLIQKIILNLTKNRRTKFARLSSLEQAMLISDAEKLVFPESILLGKKHFYLKCNNAFKTACRELGLKNYNMHDLRHTAAMDWYLKSNDIIKVSKALGHKSIQMTEQYLNAKKISIDHLYEPVKSNPYRNSNVLPMISSPNTNSTLQIPPKPLKAT
jgi:integrase